MNTTLLIHAVSTWFMVGLIWTIQLVHYPLFVRVGGDGFVEYEAEHTRRMGLLLAVPASVEVVTGGLLVWLRPSAVPLWLVFVAGTLLVFVWTMTLFAQVPLHGRLGSGFDRDVVAGLVRSNWWRTTAWTIRGAAIAAMVALV